MAEEAGEDAADAADAADADKADAADAAKRVAQEKVADERAAAESVAVEMLGPDNLDGDRQAMATGAEGKRAEAVRVPEAGEPEAAAAPKAPKRAPRHLAPGAGADEVAAAMLVDLALAPTLPENPPATPATTPYKPTVNASAEVPDPDPADAILANEFASYVVGEDAETSTTPPPPVASPSEWDAPSDTADAAVRDSDGEESESPERSAQPRAPIPLPPSRRGDEDDFFVSGDKGR
jgi:hypothetical protein